jgi:hypothetical protein
VKPPPLKRQNSEHWSDRVFEIMQKLDRNPEALVRDVESVPLEDRRILKSSAGVPRVRTPLFLLVVKERSRDRAKVEFQV